MAFEQQPVIMFGCTFCTLVFTTNADKNAHTLSHFQQKHCEGCNQSLIYVADVWYQVHPNENCTVIKDEIIYRPIEFQSVSLNEYIDVPLVYSMDEQQILNEQCEIKIEKELLCEPFELNVLADIPSENSKEAQIQNRRNSKRCNFCGATYLSSSTLIRHKRFKHREEILADCPFICVICSLHFKKKFHYRKHLLEKHGIDEVPEENQSASADKSFDTTASSTEKEKVENQTENMTNIDNSELNDSMLLGDDDISSLAMDILIDDIKLSQDDDIFDDDIAEPDSDIEEESITSPTNESHNSSTARIEKKRCDFCSATYSNTSSMLRHKRNAHREECLKESSFTCKICVLPFRVEYFYVKHMRDKHDIEIDILVDSVEPIINRSKRPDLQANVESDALESTLNLVDDTERVIRMTGPTIICCNLCPAKYKSSSSLSRHRRSAHSEELKDVRKLECDMCKERFGEKSYLLKHMLRKHRLGEKALNDLQMVQCPFCELRFQTSNTLRRHKRVIHKDKLATEGWPFCKVCDVPYESEIILERHMIEKHDVSETENYYAETIFNDEQGNEIKQHDSALKQQDSAISIIPLGKTKLKRKHFACSLCSAVFNNRKALARHRHQKHRKTTIRTPHPRASYPPKKYCCTFCPRSYGSMTSLCRHRRIAHSDRRRLLNCHLCSKKFEAVEKVRQHMLEEHKTAFEPSVRRYTCYKCSIPHRTPGLLVNHLKTHTDVEYKCCIDQCSERFEAPSELHEHLLNHDRKHREEHRRKCDKCRRIYTRWTIAGHNCIEQEKRNHMCDYCGKMFRFRNGLAAHINVHTGNRPYKCTVCDKTFNNINGRRAHALTHTDEKPIKCKAAGCNEAFKIHKQLHLHEFSAHGIHRRTHQCTVCDRIFPEKVWLRNHLKTHGIVMESNPT